MNAKIFMKPYIHNFVNIYIKYPGREFCKWTAGTPITKEKHQQQHAWMPAISGMYETAGIPATAKKLATAWMPATSRDARNSRDGHNNIMEPATTGMPAIAEMPATIGMPAVTAMPATAGMPATTQMSETTRKPAIPEMTAPAGMTATA